MSQTTLSEFYPEQLDLTNCDKEPIHMIGRIQEFGALIAVHSQSHLITRCSANIGNFFDQAPIDVLGIPIESLLEKELIEEMGTVLGKEEIFFGEYSSGEKTVMLIAHKSHGEYVLEFEPLSDANKSLGYHQQLASIVAQLNNIQDVQNLVDESARLIKGYLGYDRVMIYQFDEEWNGSVVAEEKEDNLESWKGLHYPASDIPPQARALFLKKKMRVIQDVNADPVGIQSLTMSDGTKLSELDLTNSELRAVSPMHIEYLVNMKVGASFTAAIIVDNILWGLIACHHYDSKSVNYYQRVSCQTIVSVISSRLSFLRVNDLIDKTKKSLSIRNAMVDKMNESLEFKYRISDFEQVNDITDSQGAAVCISGEVRTMGITPDDEDIVEMLKVIRQLTSDSQYVTKRFMSDYDGAVKYKNIASGVFCLFISGLREDAVLWFKPEVAHTVQWAGDPYKKSQNDTETLSPRSSFEKWVEKKSGYSHSWEDHEIAEVMELHRQKVVEIILRKNEEVKILSDQLVETNEELAFSYSISHDMRAPLRGIDGFAQILSEDYSDQLDALGKRSIEQIIHSAAKMNALIDGILEFSGLNYKPISHSGFSLSGLINETYRELKMAYGHVELVVKDEPLMIKGDRSMISLLMKNLMENAFKYSSKEEKPMVTIGLNNDTFYVKDNGIGFEQSYAKEVFQVFKRLVNEDQYQGTGIGLAIARRVVEKHDGEIWVDSIPNEGSTFYFKLNNYG